MINIDVITNKLKKQLADLAVAETAYYRLSNDRDNARQVMISIREEVNKTKDTLDALLKELLGK